jgi:hypothetical protein
VSFWPLSAGSSLWGKRKPWFLKATPISLSLGTPLWQKLHLLPVCLAKLGVASAFGAGTISANAIGAATRAPASAMDLSLRRPLLAVRRPNTILPRDRRQLSLASAAAPIRDSPTLTVRGEERGGAAFAKRRVRKLGGVVPRGALGKRPFLADSLLKRSDEAISNFLDNFATFLTILDGTAQRIVF